MAEGINEGHTTRAEEWRQVMIERMILHKNDHFITRGGSLAEDFESALKEAMGKARDELGIIGEGIAGVHELVVLDDRTPLDGWDGPTVVEAIKAMRDPPSILDIKMPGSVGKIRRACEGNDVFQEIMNKEDVLNDGGWLNNQVTLEEMDLICENRSVGLLRIKDGDIFRVREKGLFPDVVYDEDKDHYYINGVGPQVAIKEKKRDRMKVIFWNCNGWGWNNNSADRSSMVGHFIEAENADMICVTDTRLCGVQELWALAEVERTVSRITGKTWGHRSISKRGGCVAGGMMVLYSDAWAGITLRELVSHGCMIE